jgi:hypothetical protein
MEIRRATYGAAIRVAIVLSTIAVVVAWGLEAVGDVPRVALVLAVIVVGFAASWVQTGRITRSARRRGARRVVVVPVRHPVV